MGGRVCWAVGVLILALHCASSAYVPHPTPEHPVPMCHVSCPEGGFLFGPQLMCRGGKRWFEDFLATGEHVVRAVDGTIALAVWVSTQGDFAKSESVPRRCVEVIRDAVQSRSASERGIMPGEDETGRPKP